MHTLASRRLESRCAPGFHREKCCHNCRTILILRRMCTSQVAADETKVEYTSIPTYLRYRGNIYSLCHAWPHFGMHPAFTNRFQKTIPILLVISAQCRCNGISFFTRLKGKKSTCSFVFGFLDSVIPKKRLMLKMKAQKQALGCEIEVLRGAQVNMQARNRGTPLPSTGRTNNAAAELSHGAARLLRILPQGE